MKSFLKLRFIIVRSISHEGMHNVCVQFFSEQSEFCVLHSALEIECTSTCEDPLIPSSSLLHPFLSFKI